MVDVPAGWYPNPDPGQQGTNRYWDGSAWTAHVQAVGVAAPAVRELSVLGTEYASWLRRFVGTIIDNLILSPVMLLFLVPAMVQGFSDAMDNAGVQDYEPSLGFYGLIIFGTFVYLVVMALYLVLCTAKWGQTVGNRVAGTIVVMASDGSVPDMGAAVRRTGILVGFNAGYQLPFVGFLFGLGLLVDYFSMFWNPKSQCWHDMVADTVVALKPVPVMKASL